MDGDDSEALFYVDDIRIIGSIWWRGINVVVLDPVYGSSVRAEVIKSYYFLLYLIRIYV